MTVVALFASSCALAQLAFCPPVPGSCDMRSWMEKPIVLRHELANEPSSSGALMQPSSWPHVQRHRTVPFFCRLEYRLEQKSGVPFKFRLGLVSYVDWLEGKRRWPD